MATINLNDGVDVAPRYHFVRLAACDTTPPPRMFDGVWYHATNMTCRLFIFPLLDSNIYSKRARESKNI
jgi:hypothetical protein